jgi:hypothetical protein
LVELTGGQVIYSDINKDLCERNDFEVIKLIIMLKMLKNYIYPTKFFKPNKTGIKVNFNAINNEANYKKAISQIEHQKTLIGGL